MDALLDVDWDEESSWSWSELPESLKEYILAWLPLQSLSRFSMVCNQWNALLSSSKFITNEWAIAVPNRKPLLILCSFNSELPSMTYSFFTQTWRNSFSFHFLQPEEDGRNERFNVSYHGSAGGLFLVGACDRFHFTTYHVCNPLTTTSLQLPPMSSIQKVTVIGMCKNAISISIVNFKNISEFNNNNESESSSYTVVAVGRSHRENVEVLEIYDSSENCWRIVGQLPENVRLMPTRVGDGGRLIFCNGICYSLAINTDVPRRERRGIIGFNIADGTSNFASLPFQTLDLAPIGWPQLLTCGSRVLLTGGISDNQGLSNTVGIWEFHSNSSLLAEITRMPASMLNRISPIGRFDSVGMKDCVCFIVYKDKPERETVVAIYNLNQNSWGWLPNCPMNSPTKCLSFEARLDIQVRSRISEDFVTGS